MSQDIDKEPVPIAPRQHRDARQRRLLEREGLPYRLLIESVRDYAIFMLDPTGHVASWNAGAERIKGYTADEIIGRSLATFYTREDIAAGRPQRNLDEAEAFGRVEDEGWRLRKDGTRFWANVTITALRAREGSLIGFAKITRDLTNRREAERRLRESEERFRLLVDSVRDYAIFMLDPAGRIMSWNAGAEKMKGYSAEEILGKHFSIFYTPEDLANAKPEKELRTATEEGRVEDVGWRMRKDGTRFLADVVITAVWDENGALRGYSKVTRDVTDQQRAEAERAALLEARVRAEETNRAKDEFLMTLSHELRTPMTSIMGWARMLADGNLSAEETRTAVNSILESSVAQATIINDVLDVSRLMTGKLQLQIGIVDAQRLGTELVAALIPAARAKHIELVTDIEPGIGGIPADSDRLRQVIWNLLSNAIKFSPKGQSVTLRMRRAASNLEIRVDDHGPGVPPDVLPFIFQPFVQADSSSTRRHGGLGLGLTIVRNLVELHGGSVSVTNLPEGGASFRVVIPIAALKVVNAREHQAAREAAVRKRTEAVRLDGAKVMFVDDHSQSRQLVKTVLTHAGAVVETVASVAEALAALKRFAADVIITDIAMPDSDGYALARELRQRHTEGERRRVPLIAFTAFGGFAEKQPPEMTELFDAWLGKPLDPAELINAVARQLARN